MMKMVVAVYVLRDNGGYGITRICDDDSPKDKCGGGERNKGINLLFLSPVFVFFSECQLEFTSNKNKSNK